MACRSTGLGQLPQRLAAPLRQSLLNSAQLPTSLACAGATGRSAPALPTSNSTHRTYSRTARRALHTSSPRQKFDWKKLLVGRVAQRLVKGKSTYYIYIASERLYKACAKQAEYAIEEADRKAGKLKTTADGEEIGASQGGPWHNGVFFPFHILLPPV